MKIDKDDNLDKEKKEFNFGGDEPKDDSMNDTMDNGDMDNDTNGDMDNDLNGDMDNDLNGDMEQLPPDLDEYFKELSADEVQQIRDSEQEKLYIVIDEDTHYIRAFIPEVDDEESIKEKGGYVMRQDKFLELYDESDVVKNEELKESLAKMLTAIIKDDKASASAHLSNYLNEKSAQVLARRQANKG